MVGGTGTHEIPFDEHRNVAVSVTGGLDLTLPAAAGQGHYQLRLLIGEEPSGSVNLPSTVRWINAVKYARSNVETVDMINFFKGNDANWYAIPSNGFAEDV